MDSFDDDIEEMTDDEVWQLAIAPDHVTRAQALMTISCRASQNDNGIRAIELVELAALAWNEADRPLEEGFAWYTRCRLQINRGEFEEALSAAEHAVALYTDSAPDEVLAQAVEARGLCYEGMEEPEIAHYCFREARQLYENSEFEHAAAHAAVRAAANTHIHSELWQDLVFARDTFRAEGNIEWVVHVQDLMVSALISTEKIDEATAVARENLQLARFITNERRIAQALRHLGMCLFIAGDSREAIKVFNKAAQGLRAIKAWGELGSTHEYLLLCYRAIGKTRKAEMLEGELIAFYRALGDEENALTLEIEQVNRDLSEHGEHAHEKSLLERIAFEEGSSVDAPVSGLRLTLAEIYAARGNSELALNILVDEFPCRWHDPINQVRHTNVLARTALLDGRFAESRALARRVIERRDVACSSHVARAYVIVMEIAYRDGNDAEAEDYRRRALSMFLADQNLAEARSLTCPDLPETPREIKGRDVHDEHAKASTSSLYSS
jgi:tetratricopeptide (TPR) repeat protein